MHLLYIFLGNYRHVIPMFTDGQTEAEVTHCPWSVSWWAEGQPSLGPQGTPWPWAAFFTSPAAFFITEIYKVQCVHDLLERSVIQTLVLVISLWKSSDFSSLCKALCYLRESVCLLTAEEQQASPVWVGWGNIFCHSPWLPHWENPSKLGCNTTKLSYLLCQIWMLYVLGEEELLSSHTYCICEKPSFPAMTEDWRFLSHCC